jgi:cell division protein FtsB
MIYKLFLTFLIFAEIVLTTSYLLSSVRALQSQGRLDFLRNSKIELASELSELQERYEYVSSDLYVADMARNSLFLARENEVVFVIYNIEDAEFEPLSPTPSTRYLPESPWVNMLAWLRFFGWQEWESNPQPTGYESVAPPLSYPAD